ncbi:MAG: cobalt-zinc-cadmium resistance protein [Gammaproteobacteria bacterium RIFCSPLOWO2_02_FULL_56_15]|nr:MAG: cobalt-zinc-cadmium resistance protein [Gammaproteobacteria bacterium RIFCSPLOWO2_02_FULL_56_15]
MQITNHQSWLFGLAVTTLLAGSAPYSSPAVAQTPIGPAADDARAPLTLAAALELALRASPDLAVAYRELEAAEGAIIQGHAHPNPEALLLLEDTRQATRTTTLQLSQRIELGGKRAARIDAAERGRDIASEDLAARQAEIQATVTGAFFEVAVAQEGVRLARDSVELARSASEAAAKRVQAGRISPVEETKARVAEANARIDLSQAQSELTTARQRLAATWGDPIPYFSRVEGSVDSLPALPSIDALQTRLAGSPNLRRAQFEIERRKALADLERAKRIPDVTVSLGVMRDEQLDRDQALIGVSVPIPIFDSNRGNLLEALKREDKARDEHVAIQNRLGTEAFEARERLNAARTQAETLDRDVLPGAQNAYDAATKGFQLGKFNFLDVLDAQRTLFQAKTQYLRALAEAHRAAADIHRLLGNSADVSPQPDAKP